MKNLFATIFLTLAMLPVNTWVLADESDYWAGHSAILTDKSGNILQVEYSNDGRNYSVIWEMKGEDFGEAKCSGSVNYKGFISSKNCTPLYKQGIQSNSQLLTGTVLELTLTGHPAQTPAYSAGPWVDNVLSKRFKEIVTVPSKSGKYFAAYLSDIGTPWEIEISKQNNTVKGTVFVNYRGETHVLSCSEGDVDAKGKFALYCSGVHFRSSLKGDLRQARLGSSGPTAGNQMNTRTAGGAIFHFISYSQKTAYEAFARDTSATSTKVFVGYLEQERFKKSVQIPKQEEDRQERAAADRLVESDYWASHSAILTDKSGNTLNISYSEDGKTYSVVWEYRDWYGKGTCSGGVEQSGKLETVVCTPVGKSTPRSIGGHTFKIELLNYYGMHPAGPWNDIIVKKKFLDGDGGIY